MAEAGGFFFQAEDGIRDADVTGVQTWLFRARTNLIKRARNQSRSSGPACTVKAPSRPINGQIMAPGLLPHLPSHGAALATSMGRGQRRPWGTGCRPRSTK